MNSRRRLAPPLGTRGDSGLVQSSGGPGAQPHSAKGWQGSAWGRRGKKGEKKALGTQKGTNLPKPLICAEAKPSECPKPTKNQCLVPLEGPSQRWEAPAQSWDSPGEGKATRARAPAAGTPLFLCVFHLLAFFFPLFGGAGG